MTLENIPSPLWGGGLLPQASSTDRMILAQAVGRKLLARYGDSVLLIAVTIPAKHSHESGTSLLRLSVVLRDVAAGRGETHHPKPTVCAFLADGLCTQIRFDSKAFWLATVGAVDLDWPVHPPLFDQALPLFDSGGNHLAQLARAEAEREAHEIGPALVRAILGDVLATGRDVIGRSDRQQTTVTIAAFAWTVARTIAIANRQRFSDTSLWAAETLAMRLLPLGWQEFVAAISSPNQNPATEAATVLLEAMPAFARAAGEPLPQGIAAIECL